MEAAQKYTTAELSFFVYCQNVQKFNNSYSHYLKKYPSKLCQNKNICNNRNE